MQVCKCSTPGSAVFSCVSCQSQLKQAALSNPAVLSLALTAVFSTQGQVCAGLLVYLVSGDITGSQDARVVCVCLALGWSPAASVVGSKWGIVCCGGHPLHLFQTKER